MAKGALKRDPKFRIQPVRDTGRVYAGGPGGEPKTSPVPQGSMRLSPGVYRAPTGQLMTGRGRLLPPQGQRLSQSMTPANTPTLPSPQSLMQNVANQPMVRPPAPNSPMVTASVDMQKPWMNYQPPQLPQMPQRPQLGIGEVSRMSGEEIQQYIDQLQRLKQAQQQPATQSVGPVGNYGMPQQQG